MNPGIRKKVIFSFILFTNLIQPVNSYSVKINLNNSISNQKIFSFEKEFLDKNHNSLLVFDIKKKQELVIQSDTQSEINGVIYAEGNVSVSFRDKLFKADSIIYDKFKKRISAQGNISLLLGNQIFKVSYLEYSFISEKGYLLDVKGSIKTDTLMDDLSSNFSVLDSNKIETLLELQKKQVLNTPGMIKLADKLPPEVDPLRIVQIGEVDIQADGGTHVANTKEVGGIKFLKAENKGKNNRRVYFGLE